MKIVLNEKETPSDKPHSPQHSGASRHTSASVSCMTGPGGMAALRGPGVVPAAGSSAGVGWGGGAPGTGQRRAGSAAESGLPGGPGPGSAGGDGRPSSGWWGLAGGQAGRVPHAGLLPPGPPPRAFKDPCHANQLRGGGRVFFFLSFVTWGRGRKTGLALVLPGGGVGQSGCPVFLYFRGEKNLEPAIDPQTWIPRPHPAVLKNGTTKTGPSVPRV